MFRIVAVLRLCSSVQSLNRVRAGMGVAHLYTRMVADTHADYCSLTTTLVRLYTRFTKRARFYALFDDGDRRAGRADRHR